MANSLPRNVKGYEIEELIGKGGFGEVYRAFQPVIGREVAIKVILPIYANQPDFIRRFETEAQLVAKLEHPHIVPLFDYWRDTDGAFLVMRYFRGGSLYRLSKEESLQLTAIETITIVQQIASALALAHRNNVIHRDVKPHNIMLDEEKNAYLTDFGIALSATSQRNPSEEEFFSGSPAYAAPELIRGEGVSPQTDIYAFGILIYELLTNEHPFGDGSFTKMVQAQLSDPIPNLPEQLNLPPSVNKVIQRATAKDVHDRYQDVTHLANAFRQAMLGDEPITNPGIRDTTHIKNPYKGLLAFQEGDANDFFGREALIGQIINRLKEKNSAKGYERFLAVVGPSGIGKSSVVQAGLIPALRDGLLKDSENWFIVQIEPDDKPISNVQAALLSIARTPPDNLHERLYTDTQSLTWAINTVLPDTTSELVFIIDNFEELFTLTEDETERIQYLKLLYNAISHPNSRLRVIIMMRADYYDRPLLYEDFGGLLQERTQLVLPLSRQEIERAVRSPAERNGLQVETGFIDAILSDVRDEPGALPLLQYALTESFAYREGARLSSGSYRSTGGIYGALSQRAEEVYQSFETPELQDLSRQVLLRLISIGDTGDKRRRTPRAELVALGNPQQVNQILDAFGQYRILTFEGELGTREPKVEIAHEALISEWERMQGWLTENRDDIRTERLLSNATAEWKKSNHDNSYLLSGARLAQFEAWSQITKLSLTPDELSFIHESIKVRDTATQHEKERTQRELDLARETAASTQRAANRLKIIIGGLIVASIVGFILLALAINAQRVAEEQRLIADRNAREAQSLQTAFRSQLELASGRPDIALALALEASAVENAPSLVNSILIETAYSRNVQYVYNGHDVPLMTIALNQDGTQLLSAGGRYSDTQELNPDTAIHLWDLETQTLVREFTGHTDTVWDVVYSPDDRLIASASADNTIKIWNAQTGEVLHTLTAHTNDVRAIDFSPDGRFVLSGSGDYSDGTLTPESDFSVRLWNAETGEAICTFEPRQPIYSEINDVKFSPNGFLAVSASGAEFSPLGDNNVILWNVETCQEIRRFRGHQHIVKSVDISPDNQYILSGSADNTLILWDITNGTRIRTLRGHVDWVTTVKFDSSGIYALSGGWDNTIILWNVTTGDIIYQYVGHSAPIQSVLFSSDGLSFFSASQDTTVRQWDYENPLFLKRYGTTYLERSTRTQYSHNQRLLISANPSGLISVYNVERGVRIGTFKGHVSEINSLNFSQDDQFVLSADSNGEIILWDVINYQEIRRYEGHSGGVWGANFLQNDQLIVSGSDDSTVRIWDINTGEQLHIFDTDLSEVYTTAVSPDGRYFFAGSLNTQVIQWDVQTMQEVHRFNGHTSAPIASQVSPNGQFLATGGYDNLVILWDIESGQPLQYLSGHSKTVITLNFNVDSTIVISSSLDGTVRFWDVATGAELGRIDYGVPLASSSGSSDGRSIAIASEGGFVATYDYPILDIPVLIEWINENRALYRFSCDERTRLNLSPCTSP
jgi:WD40 repeat protein/serine/threonine protein kinase